MTCPRCGDDACCFACWGEDGFPATGCEPDACPDCGDAEDECACEDAGPEYRTRHHADQDDRTTTIHRDERGNA